MAGLRPPGARGADRRYPPGPVLPLADLSYAIVALYLGLEMLSHLEGDRAPALALFARAKQLAPMVEAISGANFPGAPS